MTMKKVIGYDVDDVLELMGLERRTTLLGMMIPAATFLAIGATIGAGIALAFAPSSGRRLRQEVGDKFENIRDRAKTEGQRVAGLNNATPHPAS